MFLTVLLAIASSGAEQKEPVRNRIKISGYRVDRYKKGTCGVRTKANKSMPIVVGRVLPLPAGSADTRPRIFVVLPVCFVGLGLGRLNVSHGHAEERDQCYVPYRLISGIEHRQWILQ